MIAEDINEAGFKDFATGALLYKALDVPIYEFSADPSKFEKLRTLASFLNEHPDPQWVIERLKNNKSSMSKLDFLTSYASLAMKKQTIAQTLQDIEKEMKAYE